MTLNEDRDRRKDQITRIALRTARVGRVNAEKALVEADHRVAEALDAYREHFGTDEVT